MGHLTTGPASPAAVIWADGPDYGRRRALLSRPLVEILRAYWPLGVIAALAACLVFTNLGRDYLWEDEGDTAVLARNILRTGLPVAWDGVTFIDPDYGQRLKFGFVMVSHPWLQYYATALSFWLFGETPWAARLPFALAGVATIVAVYAMLMDLVRNRLAAISAAALLTTSVQFLIFSRQARNYSFNALLTCLLVWQFCRLRSRASAASFAAIGIVLFHAHPIGLAALSGLGLLTLIAQPDRKCRRLFWGASLCVALYALPWLVVSRTGFEPNMTASASAGRVLPRLLQFAVECASVTPIVGVAILGIVSWLRVRPARQPTRGRTHRARPAGAFTPDERLLILACACVILAEAVAMAFTHSRDDIWVVGLHHAPALIPLGAMLAGLMIACISGSSRTVWVVLTLVFACTRIGQAAPWTFWAEAAVERDPKKIVTFHVPRRPADRILRTTLIPYAGSLLRPNPGVIAGISTFLEANASPDDVVITNYGWEALYFHTGLPQGAKISRSFPIYTVAAAAKLPDYVFGTSRARWIVWRRAFPAYFAEQDCDRILRQLGAEGASTRLVAEIPETLYENRENIHFRRFAGDVYPYPWYQNLPSVQIYRVETFDESIVHYRKSLETRPDDPLALAGLGVALAVTGKLDEAVPVFRRAVAGSPMNAGAHRNLANALFDQGNAVDASLHAQRAVELAGDNPAAYDLFGRALAVQGRFAEAAREFERAIEIDGAYADARDHLEQLRRYVKKD